MDNLMDMIDKASEVIAGRVNFKPEIAIILGSGLGPLANEVENPIVIDYSDIPYFPVSTIPGHEGKLVAGTIRNKRVIVMKGRFHYYEGHDMPIVTLPIRVFAKLGIKNILVTNACGGIRDDLNPGDIMLINDHIGFMCPSPLRGPNLDEFGPRFKDMTQVYSVELMEIARDVAQKLNIKVNEGVYAYFKGPMFETPSEIRAIRTLGADAAGMSTVPEAITARHCGMNILGISLITNKAAGLSTNELNHVEVMETAASAEKNLVKLANEIIVNWPTH